jgi:hypothetical protein
MKKLWYILVPLLAALDGFVSSVTDIQLFLLTYSHSGN